MTKEVNVRHVFTQTKKEGGGPPFFGLIGQKVCVKTLITLDIY